MPENNTTGAPFDLLLETPGVSMKPLTVGNPNLQKINDMAMGKQDYDPPEEEGQPMGPVLIAGGIKAFVQNFFESVRDAWVALATPAGVVMQYAGPAAPTGFLLCQGQEVSRTTYANLFAAISTTFGSGDGSTTFMLPDMRNRFPLGFDANLGGTGGATAHSLLASEMPAHVHDVNAYVYLGSGGRYATMQLGNALDYGNKSGSAGGSQAHNNMPPYLALAYIIKF